MIRLVDRVMTITFDISLSSALVESKSQKYPEKTVCSVKMNEIRVIVEVW